MDDWGGEEYDQWSGTAADNPYFVPDAIDLNQFQQPSGGGGALPGGQGEGGDDPFGGGVTGDAEQQVQQAAAPWEDQSVRAFGGNEPQHWDEFFNWIHPQTMGGLGAATGYEKGPEWGSFASQWDPSRATATSPFWSPGGGRDPTFANQALAWTPAADQQAQFDLFNQMGQGALMSPEGALAQSQESFDVWDANRIALENLYGQFESTGPGQFAQTAQLGGDPGNPQDLWNLQVAEPWNQRVRQLQAAEAARVTCWDGSTAATEAECPPPKPPNGEVTCWNGTKAATQADCPPQPPTPGKVTCWDGSQAATQADCPDQPPPRDYEAECIQQGGKWVDGACDYSRSAVIDVDSNLPDPWLGDIPEDVTATDYPFTTPQMQTVGNVQMGDDPVSELTNATIASGMLSGGIPNTYFGRETQGALGSIMGAGGGGGAAETPFGGGVQEELQNLIANRGQVDPDPQRQAMEFEQLRSPIDAMRRAQMAQGQAAMAERGTLGQGTEVDFLERLEGRLAPAYAAAGQQLALRNMEQADQRYMDALSQGGDMAQAQANRREERLSSALALATGLSEQAAANMMDSARTWNERQAMLADVALRNLDANINWSEFVANFGLERDQIIEMIRSGRLDALAETLNQNLAGLQLIAQGFVPYGNR